MRSLVLSFLSILLTVSFAQAQEATLEGVSARGFSGVQTLGGEFYYTSYFGEKSETKGMANFVLALYDQDLKPIKSTNIEISKNSELAASAFNGQSFLFLFADLGKKKRTLVTLDKQGSIIKQRVDEVDRAALLVPENYPDIHGINGDEFVVVRREKDKKFGYEIERLDKDLNSKWTKAFFPEKGNWAIEDSRLQQGKLYLLRKEKAALIGDKHTYSVQGINLETGDPVYTTALVHNENGGFPDFIRVSDDGTVATGGMYFKDGKYDDKNSDGLFFALIASDGSIKTFSETSWKQVKDQIQGEFSSDLFGGRTKVLVEDVVQTKDGNYLIVAETWRKSNNAENTGMGALRSLGGMGGGSSSGSSKERGFTLMDFSLFYFDAAGALKKIDKVEKTSKEAMIQGELASEHGLAIAQHLYKRKFFCYRTMIEANNKQYILFKNDDGIKTKAYFLPVGATSVAGIGSIDMDKWVSEGLNNLGKLSKLTGGNKYTFGSESNTFGNSNPEIYKNILPAKPGHVLLYQFSNGKLAMWLQAIPQ